VNRKTNTTTPYPAAFRERAVLMVVDRLDGHASLTGGVPDIAGELARSPDSLRVWHAQARRDAGKDAGPPSAEKDHPQLSVAARCRLLSIPRSTFSHACR
jgi:transposase